MRNTPNKILRKSCLLTETQVIWKIIPFLRKDKDSVKSRATHDLHFSFKLTGSMKSN